MEIKMLITTPDPEWPGDCVCAGLHPDTLAPAMLRLKGLDWDSKTCIQGGLAYILDSFQMERLRCLRADGSIGEFTCTAKNGRFTVFLTSMKNPLSLTKR